VQQKFKLRALVPFFVALGLGSVTAGLSPPRLLLPIFFCCIAGVVFLAIAAHKIQVPASWQGAQRLAAVVAVLALSSPGADVKHGPLPRMFIWSLLFTFGFVTCLAFLRAA
jgi:hypothetical protein